MKSQGQHRTRLVVALMALTAGGGVILWIALRSSASSQAWRGMPVPSMGSNDQASVGRPTNLDSEASRRTTIRMRTAREVLAEYWGDRWAEMEAQLIAKGVELDKPCESGSWEEVRTEFQDLARMSPAEREGYHASFVQWPQALDDAWLKANLGIDRALTAEQLAALDAAVAEKNERLETLADDALARIDLALQDAWQRDRVVKAPVTLEGVGSALPCFMGKAKASHGWAAAVKLSHAEHPEISSLLKQLNVLRQQRNSWIHSYVSAL